MVDERLRGMGMILKPTTGGPTHNHNFPSPNAVRNYIAGGAAPNNMQMEYEASHILYYFERDLRIHLSKNRNGRTGDLSIDQFLDFALQIFANKIFNNTATVFQEGLINDMKEAINNALAKNLLKVVNKDDTI